MAHRNDNGGEKRTAEGGGGTETNKLRPLTTLMMTTLTT